MEGYATANFPDHYNTTDSDSNYCLILKKTLMVARFSFTTKLTFFKRNVLSSLFPCVIHRHVIWTSSSAGMSTFPGLADAFAKAESSGQSSDWDKVHYHLSVLSQNIAGAANTLVDVI